MTHKVGDGAIAHEDKGARSQNTSGDHGGRKASDSSPLRAVSTDLSWRVVPLAHLAISMWSWADADIKRTGDGT
jgi:hypothetical protein